MVLAGNGSLSESFALSPALSLSPPSMELWIHTPHALFSLFPSLYLVFPDTRPPKAPRQGPKAARPTESTRIYRVALLRTRTYQPRAAIVCEKPYSPMPPHAGLSLSLSLSLVLPLSLSPSLLSAVLCLSCLSCLTPPPALPRLLLSWSVCRPCLHLPYLPDYNGLMYLVYTILPPVPSSNPGDGPRCFLSWRVALIQIVSTGRLPLRKNTNL